MSESKFNIDYKGSAKKIKASLSRTRQTMVRVTNPAMWSLRGRFIYLTGVLLVLGNLSLIFFLSYSLEKSLDEFAEQHLELTRTLVVSQLEQEQLHLTAHTVSAARIPAVQEALVKRDWLALKDFFKPYTTQLRQITGLDSLNLDIYDSGSTLLLSTSGSEPVDGKKILAAAVKGLNPVSGIERSQDRLYLLAAAPVDSRNGSRTGLIMLTADLNDIIKRINVPPNYKVSFLASAEDIPVRQKASDSWIINQVHLTWRLVRQYGQSWMGSDDSKAQQAKSNYLGSHYFTHLEFPLLGAEATSLMLISYDSSALLEAKLHKLSQFTWFFLAGALFLWLILFVNVTRIERFFRRLRKIIIASHSNYFSDRFESDHIHCLDLMHCHNEECPVFQNPSLICYLETGTEAISPKWKNTCIFLNKYDTCANCPVYAMRRGDELTEMRNVVNTMMRHWGDFLTRVGHLLAYVLRSQEQTGKLPTLDDISERLEHMAKLTFFSHDLQGVMSKDEVYQHITHKFEELFNIQDFMVFEIQHDASKALVVLDSVPEVPLCKREVLESAVNCRASRVSEELTSFFNPVLCPYFNCDTDKSFRCCLPIVMGGSVGAVFTFMKPKRDWERTRRELPIIRKYLDETGPVLSSLSLLKKTKEQALRDPLTLCHNRRFLDEFIVKYEPLSQREGRKTGFLMADLDYFKKVNDQYGHEAGDEVLKQIVKIIEDSIRRSDLLIRYGGEEFLILLQNLENGTAKVIADKIRASVEEHNFILPGGTTINKTISVGVSEYPTDADAMYKAIKFADVALYEAKNQGRNKVLRFEKEMWTSEDY